MHSNEINQQDQEMTKQWQTKTHSIHSQELPINLFRVLFNLKIGNMWKQLNQKKYCLKIHVLWLGVASV